MTGGSQSWHHTSRTFHHPETPQQRCCSSAKQGQAGFYVLFTDEPPAPRATPNCSLAEGKVSARPPSRRTRVLAWKMKEQLESRCCLQAGPTAPERRVHQPRARISAHWGSPSHHCQCPGDLPQDPGPARPREEGRLSILSTESGAHPGDPHPWYISELPSALS